MKSPQFKPHNYVEGAIEIHRNCVAVDRATGKKTLWSLFEQARFMGVPSRRPRSFFERDRPPFVGIDEYTRILLRGARYIERAVDRIRAVADRWEAEAALMRSKHEYLTGLGYGKTEEWPSNGGPPLRKHSA